MATALQLSILTRTFNRPVFLQRCFKSLLDAQPEAAQWLIVNDAPENDSQLLLQQVDDFRAKADFDIKLVQAGARHRTKALNVGLAQASGTYLHILDDDDTIQPLFYSKLIEFLEADVEHRWGAVAAKTERVDEVLHCGVVLEKQRRAHYPELKVITLLNMACTMTTPPCSLIFRRAAIASMSFDETFRVGEDHDFLLRFLLAHDICLLPEVLAVFHHRQGHQGSTGNSEISQDFEIEAALFRNQLLRRDIASNSLGLGWLVAMADMSSGTIRLNALLQRLYGFPLFNRLYQRFRRG